MARCSSRGSGRWFLFVGLAVLATVVFASANTPPDAPGIEREAVLTRAPEPRTPVDIVMPPGALQPGESAEVVLIIDIDAGGRVGAATVTQSAGALLDEAARAGLLRTEFVPAEINGQPAAVRIEYRHRFEVASAPAPVPAMAQELPLNFKGRVLERGSRDPLRGATVYLPDHNLTAETDADGRFEMRGVPAGRIRVQITERRHRKYEILEDFAEGQLVELTAYLQKTVAGGREIVVVGERDKKDVVKRVLQREELKTVPGTLGDPIRVLQSLPGVSRPIFISGALIIRGANPNDSKVMVDGVPIPILFHLGGGPSVVTPSFIDKINFYPGLFGARYGNAIGGIVDIDTYAPKKDARMHGEIKIDLLDSRFYVETPLGAENQYGTLILAARRSYIDTWLPSVLEAANRASGGGGGFRAIPVYWDYQGRYSLEYARQRFEVTAFGSNDSFTLARTGTIAAQNFSLNTQSGFHRVRFLWNTPLPAGWTLTVAPMLGTTPSGTDVNDLLKVNVDSIDAGLRAYARKELSPDLKLEIGTEDGAARYDLRFETAGYPTATNPNPAPSVRTQRIYGGIAGIYGDVLWSPLKSFRVIPGLRLDEYKTPGGFQDSIEPRLALRYELGNELTLKGGTGVYRQLPIPQRLDKVLGNPYLQLEQSEQIGGGAEYQIAPSVLLDVQTYYSWRHNLTSASRAIVWRDGAYVPENYNNSGKGRAYGVEMMLKHDLTERFYGWVSYTWSRAEEISKLTGQYAPSSFDQTHMLGVVASYKLERGWEIGMRYRLTTGRPETPIIGATYDVDANRYFPVYGAPGSTRGATYSQLDLRVERLWTFDWWRFAAYLDVQNVLNADNPEMTLWDYRYGKSAPLRGLPILPVLGIRGEF